MIESVDAGERLAKSKDESKKEGADKADGE
jgi:hypothetical protein